MSPYIKGVLFIACVIGLSIVLDRLNPSDDALEVGECIKINIGNAESIHGQIYNLRADGRYNVYYTTERSQIHTITLRRFQFTIVDCELKTALMP